MEKLLTMFLPKFTCFIDGSNFHLESLFGFILGDYNGVGDFTGCVGRGNGFFI